MARLIDADKLLKWIEHSPKADGFWGNGSQAISATEAFDNLTDAIENGILNPDQLREDPLDRLNEEIAYKTIVNSALHIFPKSLINRNNEIILEPRNNVYFRLDEVDTVMDFKCKMFAWLSRPIAKGLNKYWWPRVLACFNELLGTNFTKDDMYLIYDRLGNDVNRKLTIQFIESGYDMELLKR